MMTPQELAPLVAYVLGHADDLDVAVPDLQWFTQVAVTPATMSGHFRRLARYRRGIPNWPRGFVVSRSVFHSDPVLEDLVWREGNGPGQLHIPDLEGVGVSATRVAAGWVGTTTYPTQPDLPAVTPSVPSVASELKSVKAITLRWIRRRGVAPARRTPGGFEVAARTLAAFREGIGGAWYLSALALQVEDLVMLRSAAEAAGYALCVPDDLESWCRHVAQRRNAVRAAANLDGAFLPDPSGIVTPLRPWQRTGIAFIQATGGRCYLGDSMGVGKTGTMIGYAMAGNHRTLVVTPAQVKADAWPKAVTFFTGQTASLIGTKSKKAVLEDTDTQFFVVNAEALVHLAKRETKPATDRTLLTLTDLGSAGFSLLCLDEAHLFANPTSGRTRAAQTLAAAIPHLICASGTAIKNKPVEFFAQLQMLAPDTYTSYWDFAATYNAAYRDQWGWHLGKLSRRHDPVLERLIDEISLFYLRREMDVTELASEKTAYEHVIPRLTFEKSQHFNRAARLTENRQACAVAKVPHTTDLVRRLAETDPTKKIAVFSEFVAPAEQIADALGSEAVLVHGSIPASQRAAALAAFRTDPNVRYFVAVRASCGVGIDLTAAATVVLSDLPYSPSEVEQAIDRCWRQNQRNDVNVWRVLAPGTPDDVVIRILADKARVVDQVVGGVTHD